MARSSETSEGRTLKKKKKKDVAADTQSTAEPTRTGPDQRNADYNAGKTWNPPHQLQVDLLSFLFGVRWLQGP